MEERRMRLMNKKLEKLEGTYWKIAKIVSVLFAIINYQLWAEPYSFIKAVLLLIGIAVGTFVTINLLDLFVGMIAGIIKCIHRKIKNRRLLKRFCQSDVAEDNYNEVE